jgi:hypothetical protein
MLAIQDVANSNGPATIGTDFLLSSIELVDDQTLLVWFTRNTTGATTTSNYTVTGPSARSVILAQQNDLNGARIYLDLPLTVGQWTLSVTSITSNDPDALTLPSDTKVIFDLVDKSTQDTVGTNLVEAPVSKFIPKEFRNKKVVGAIIAGLETGDAIVRDQTRLAFDQSFLSTASGKYLNTKASDRGVPKPTKLGLSDTQFRKLAIDITNSKLTNAALLSVLETMYGEDSVRAYVETEMSGPFQLFDQGYLDFFVDGKHSFRFVANISGYTTPTAVTSVELCNSLNFAFDKNSFPAHAIIKREKVRVYSNTTGIQSKISIKGGTLQPYVGFDLDVFEGTGSLNQLSSASWTLTNPRPGIVRFTLVNPEPALPGVLAFVTEKDYVTVIGSEFPLPLRGSYNLVAVNWTQTSPTVRVQWFEIESSYVVV